MILFLVVFMRQLTSPLLVAFVYDYKRFLLCIKKTSFSSLALYLGLSSFVSIILTSTSLLYFVLTFDVRNKSNVTNERLLEFIMTQRDAE